jgi:hypothetical protein
MASKPVTKPRRTLGAPAKNAKRRVAHRAPTRLERDLKPVRARKAYDEHYFGRAPEGATHVALHRIGAGGHVDRLALVGNDGVEVNRFPLDILRIDRLRDTFGAGHYRGNWLRLDENKKWVPIGRVRDITLAQQVAQQATRPSYGRSTSSVHMMPPHQAPLQLPPALTEEEREAVDVRVRTEREMGRMRLELERELNEGRMVLWREQHDAQMQMMRAELEQSIADVASRTDGGERPPALTAIDIINGIIDKLTPTFQQFLPQLIERLLPAPGGTKG